LPLFLSSSKSPRSDDPAARLRLSPSSPLASASSIPPSKGGSVVELIAFHAAVGGVSEPSRVVLSSGSRPLRLVAGFPRCVVYDCLCRGRREHGHPPVPRGRSSGTLPFSPPHKMPTPSHRHCPNHPKGGHGDCAGACGGDGIPVIDLGVLLNGNAEQRSQATRELGQACEDWGFFMVINHGVPEALQEEVMEACKELYSLPRDEKADYIAAGPKDPIRIGTGLFYSDVDDAICRRDYMKMIAHPEFHCPAKPAKLR
uniref:Non-haem dioxygenase N-terminal domain-containing protein n=1 Tax=Aegilops tauschii subsp. strangulata TaxID=200361 RepID=A0A453FPG9_AEGTS